MNNILRLIISSVVLVVASTFAVASVSIDFHLIKTPLTEVMGNTYVLDYKIASVAALGLIIFQVILCLFVMETMRLTHIIPFIGAMKGLMRVSLIWVSVVFYILLASVQLTSVYMRESLMQLDLSQMEMLGAEASTSALDKGLTWFSLWMMLLVVFLPLASSLALFPVNYFLQSVRDLKSEK